MKIIKHEDNCIYLFDSHARNCYGMPDANGTAVVMKCGDITMLEQYLCSLSLELNSELFEIVPVQFHCDALSQSVALYDFQNIRKRKRHETDSQKLKRLAKAREYKQTKILEETPKERESRLAKMRTYCMKKKKTELNQGDKQD